MEGLIAVGYIRWLAKHRPRNAVEVFKAWKHVRGEGLVRPQSFG
jgi:hypothetical protein